MTQEPIEEEKQPPTQEEEAQEYKDKYLRILAEMDNTRKRMQKERQEMTRFAVDNVISEILAPIDNLENALKCAQNMSGEVRNWAHGFLMILDQFKEVLSNHGVSAFLSEGQQFDPQLHHAIESEETEEKPEGTILKEYVKGYRSRERTIRPAQVKVAIKSQPKQEETAPSQE